MDSTVKPTGPLKGMRQRSTHQVREARVKFWRIAIVSSFFAILIGGSLLAGGVAMVGHMQSQSRADAAAKYKTAKISRPMLDGVFCHNLILDNQSGRMVEDKVERCDLGKAVTTRPGQTQFVWGGRAQ
jgi:hypothetical protein